MTDFCELGSIFFRTGRTSELPENPPDKQAFFWDRDLSVLWGVNDAMEWVQVNATIIEEGFFLARVDFTFASGATVALLPVETDWSILNLRLHIDTPFTVGTTIMVGDSVDNDRFMTTGSNSATTAGLYEVSSDYEYSGISTVNAYIAGAPVAGAAHIFIEYYIEG